jgi:ribosomal protein L11 methyltransferase
MRKLVEISLSDLDDEAVQVVTQLFDCWGRGGAVVERTVDEPAGLAVKTYLSAEDDGALRQIEIGLELLRQARGLPEPRVCFLAEADWAEAWKAGYGVLRIGRRLVVRPTWRDDYAPQPDDLLIELDPGMAFGSGLHPTTRLCLEALEDTVRPGQVVLDVGTGSGILSIAAARLGAARVLALDTDPLAVQIARENVALNRVEAVVQVEVGTVQISNNKYQMTSVKGQTSSVKRPRPVLADRPGGGQASNLQPPISNFQPPTSNLQLPTSNFQLPTSNLIVANILAETIMELAPALAAQLLPEGVLIASGIIAERAEAVASCLRENGVSLVERRDAGDWVALVGRRGLTAESEASLWDR